MFGSEVVWESDFSLTRHSSFFGCGMRQVPTQNDTSDLQPQQQKASQKPCLRKAKKNKKNQKMKCNSPNYRVKFWRRRRREHHSLPPLSGFINSRYGMNEWLRLRMRNHCSPQHGNCHCFPLQPQHSLSFTHCHQNRRLSSFSFCQQNLREIYNLISMKFSTGTGCLVVE